MPTEAENNLRLEIGHVLFIDLVGYPKLLIEEQKERLRQLTQIVLATPRELEQLAKRQYVSPTAFATVYLGLGQKEKCLDWLGKSYEQQDSACWYLKIDQIYDSVRDEPRFQVLLKKVGLDQ